jgi:hypothetical protein
MPKNMPSMRCSAIGNQLRMAVANSAAGRRKKTQSVMARIVLG